MFNVEHLQHEIDDLLLEVSSGESRWPLSGYLCFKGEIERLTDGKRGVVVLVLLAVDGLTSIPLLEEVCIKGTV